MHRGRHDADPQRFAQVARVDLSAADSEPSAAAARREAIAVIEKPPGGKTMTEMTDEERARAILEAMTPAELAKLAERAVLLHLIEHDLKHHPELVIERARGLAPELHEIACNFARAHIEQTEKPT
jgi:hypothetical protein